MYKKLASILMGGVLMMGLSNISAAQSTKQDLALNPVQQSIVAISALTAQGDLTQLKVALNQGLDAGLTVNEIKEALIQMYAYTGFPRSLNGINTFKAVLDERKQRGIHDKVGIEPKSVRADKNKYEVGKENLALLTGVKPPENPTGYAAFVPTIEVFLKEHLFADIFERGVLDYQTRELVTISALASLGNVNDQLRSHMNVGIHNGLSEAQLRDLILIVGRTVGEKESKNANEVLNQLISHRK